MPELNLVSPDTLIALPTGASVSAGFLASQGVYSTDQTTGQVVVPSDAYAVGYGGTTYQVGAHPDWFSAYTAPKQPKAEDDPSGDPAGAGTAASLLRQYGLEELLPYVDQIARGKLTWPELLSQLYDTSTAPGKVVDRLYPEVRLRREAGKEPVSIDQIQSLRTQYRQVFKTHDAPPGFFDSVDDFRDLIVGDKSPDELNADLSEWRLVADEAAADPGNATTLAELHRLYGITPDSGAFLSYVIDPKRGLDSIHKMRATAGLGATSLRSGFGELGLSEAEQLAARGLSPDAAQQGFDELVHNRELFGALPGETGAGIGREDQLAAEFGGDARARAATERTRGQRLAEFDSGGRIGAGRGSSTGLMPG